MKTKILTTILLLGVLATTATAAEQKAPWIHTCGETTNFASLTEESMLVFMSSLAVDDIDLAAKLIDNDLVFTLKKDVKVLMIRPPDPKTRIFKGRIKGETIMIYSTPAGWCVGE